MAGASILRGVPASSLGKISRAGSGEETAKANAETADRVPQEFLHGWNAYKQYAWGHDELKGLSKGYRDWYGVSLETMPVDALGTMILMGLDDGSPRTW